MPCHNDNEKYMHRCLELAFQGIGQVAPNPMVGSLLVHKDLIIGEGFHRSYGEAHAEVNAVRQVANKELLRHASLYVNLEPCSHHGKTPPCTDLILEKEIPRVVIGTPDPNPLVAGNGIKLLRENGVQVTLGVLENECKDLNKRFFTWHLHNRPWIILKWARSSDGFIDLERPASAPIGPNWITSQTARILVHKWRAEEQAILVGTNTVLKDNPRLNVRDWTGKDPLRVVIDRKLRLNSSYHVFDNSGKTLVFTEKIPAPHKITEAAEPAKEEIVQEMKPDPSNMPSGNRVSDRGKTRYAEIIFDGTAELQMLKLLYRENIQSVIIEGGAYTLNSFIEKGLWDEARVFTGPAFFRNGVRSPEITGNRKESRMIDNSLLEIFFNT